jgi:predicted HTH domain antitoxin
MCQVSVDIPEAVLYDTRMSREEAALFSKRAVAMEYYKQGVSIGYCAQIADMTEEDFIRYLGQHQVSIFKFDDEAEFISETQNA